MAIFSGFLKSGQDLPGARTVPNGGLGGLVQIQASNEVGSGVQRKGYEDNSDKKRPSPIRLGTSEVPVPPSSAPLKKMNDDFPKSLRTPRTAVRASSGGPMSTRIIYSEAQSSQWLHSREDNQSLHPFRNVRAVTSPAGFGNGTQEPFFTDIPALPPTPNRGARSTFHVYPQEEAEPRANGSSSNRTTSTHPTQPRNTRSNEMDTFRSATRSMLKSPLINQDAFSPRSNATMSPNTFLFSTSPNSLNKDISTLSAHELLTILPKLKSKTIVNAWIPAMEKEFAKIKALADKFDGDRTQESRMIKIFSEDIKNLLKQAKEIAARYDEEFTMAQAAIDACRQTDLEKLEIAERRLHDTVTVYNRKLRENTLDLADSQRVQASLLHVNTIFGGFIRNNLAKTLHNSEDGLTEEVIRHLAAFDRTGLETTTQPPTGFIPIARYDSICRNLFDAQERIVEMQNLLEEQQMLTTSNSKQLEKLTEQLQRRTDEKRKADREIVSLRQQLENERAQNDVYREIIQSSSDKEYITSASRSKIQGRDVEPTTIGGHVRQMSSLIQNSEIQQDPVDAHQTPMNLSLGANDHISSRNTVLYRPRNIFSAVPMSPVSPRSVTYDQSSGLEGEARSASISSIASSGDWPYTSVHDPMLSPISRPHSPTQMPPTDLTRQHSTCVHYHHDDCRPLKLNKKDDATIARGRAESVTASDEWEYDWECSKYEH